MMSNITIGENNDIISNCTPCMSNNIFCYKAVISNFCI